MEGTLSRTHSGENSTRRAMGFPENRAGEVIIVGCRCGSNGDTAEEEMLRKVGWAHVGLGWREPAQDGEQGFVLSLSDFPDLRIILLNMRNGSALDGDVIQLVVCLPTMHEALGSVPNTAETGCGDLYL